MATGGTLASAGGPRPPAETGIARAETLGPDGGQRTWKPGPDAAVGQTGAQESMPILFPSPARCSGNNSGGRGGGPRGMDEEGGRPGAGTRHATPPPAGAAAGGRARTIAPYAAPPNGATLKDNNTGLDGGQDNKPQKENQIITRQARKRTDRCLASKIDDTLVSHTIDPISRPNS